MLPMQTVGLQPTVNLPQVFQAALLSNLADAVVSTDKAFNILTWNKAAETIYGVSAEEAIGANTKDIFNYSYVNSSREEAYNALLKEHKWKGVVKHLRSDGKEVLLEASVTEILSDTEELMGFVAVNRDITQVADMRFCLEGLKCTFSHVGEGIAIIDRKDKVGFVNEKAQKIMRAIGCKLFVPGEDFAGHFPLDRRARINDGLSNALNGKSSAYETFYDKGNGNLLHLEVRYCSLKNEYNEVNHAAVVVKNTTKQKREQQLTENLVKSRLQFEQFMNNSQLIGWIANDRGDMLYMNETYLRKFKLTKAYVGKSIRELFSPVLAEQYLRNNQATLDKGQAINTIEEAILPNGESRTFKVTKFPIYLKDETLIGGWAADISEDIAPIQNLKNPF